VWFSWEEI
ncbi:hypothetical protein QUC31_007228, partial [Theobroma cacao]